MDFGRYGLTTAAWVLQNNPTFVPPVLFVAIPRLNPHPAVIHRPSHSPNRPLAAAGPQELRA